MTQIPSRRAFTLIELLVVVSIIALLMALLLPALKQARATAWSAACLSNLRQMGIAIQSYAMDNNGYMPVRLYSKTYSETDLRESAWPREIWPYAMGNNDKPPKKNRGDLYEDTVLNCPVESAVKADTSFNRPYSLNTRLHKESGGPIHQSQNTTADIHRIASPAAVVLLTEQHMFRGGGINDWRWANYTSNYYGHHHVEMTLHHPGATSNTLFIDAHAENLNEEEIPFDTFFGGGPEFWQGR